MAFLSRIHLICVSSPFSLKLARITERPPSEGFFPGGECLTLYAKNEGAFCPGAKPPFEAPTKNAKSRSSDFSIAASAFWGRLFPAGCFAGAAKASKQHRQKALQIKSAQIQSAKIRSAKLPEFFRMVRPKPEFPRHRTQAGTRLHRLIAQNFSVRDGDEPGSEGGHLGVMRDNDDRDAGLI